MVLSSLVSGSQSGLLTLPTALMILFRQKYPKWWYDWAIEYVKFTTGITSYAALLFDEYPSTDEYPPFRLGP